MFGWADTGDGFNLINMDFHQSFAEIQPNLVFKFSYLKETEDLYSFNIGVLD